MAQSYFKTEHIDKAINYSFLAKEKFAQVQDREEYAKTLLLLAKEYNKRGDLTNSIKYSQKTLEVYKELNELSNISEIENNLGKLFYEFENLEESFKHYEIAKDIRVRSKDNKVVDTLINICENYIKLKDINMCEKVLSDVRKYLKEDDIKALIEVNLLWYRIYTIKEMYKEAEYILIDTYKLAKANDLLNKAGQVAIMIGKYYIDNKRDFEAAKYLDEGVTIFKKIGILKG